MSNLEVEHVQVDVAATTLSGLNSLQVIPSKPQLATKAIEFTVQTQILGQVGSETRR
jgi:hypothetical protein